MKIDLFDYNLPQELIAQFPARRRDQSRLLVLDRTRDTLEILPFGQVINYLNPGDALVVNRTKVFKARLNGNRKSGAKVEIFLVRIVDKADPLCWRALVSPSRRVKEGESIQFENDAILLQNYLGNGRWNVCFKSETVRRRIISHCGQVPLPHYIRREGQPDDLRRYQTVFADKNSVGAVAAPTAGFHFTKSLLEKIKSKGITVVELCLHVGPGTFKPVSVEQIENHEVDPEVASIDTDAVDQLNNVRQNGGKIFAVGTTSVRTLESASINNGRIEPLSRMVDLYIRPGHEFQTVDHLVTNFHLPKSSLMILVSALAGREKIMQAYQHAIANRMRFYSYGDAMLIL